MWIPLAFCCLAYPALIHHPFARILISNKCEDHPYTNRVIFWEADVRENGEKGRIPKHY